MTLTAQTTSRSAAEWNHLQVIITKKLDPHLHLVLLQGYAITGIAFERSSKA